MDNQRNTRLRRYGEGCNEDKIWQKVPVSALVELIDI